MHADEAIGNRERATDFLRDVGARLIIKGERMSVKGPLPDGSGEVTVRYARFGDMLAALEAFDVMRAMVAEDVGAIGQRQRR